MQNKKTSEILKAIIQMTIAILIIVGILQLVVSGIISATNDNTKIASEFSGNLAKNEVNPNIYSYNIPTSGTLLSTKLRESKLAPVINGFEQAYCIQKGTPAPVYEYTRIGSGYFSKENWESLSSMSSEHTNHTYGDGHVKFPYKLESTSEHYITVSNNSDEEHNEFEVPTELKTPGYYTVDSTSALSPAEAYIVSANPQGKWTEDKQNSIWDLLGFSAGGSLTAEAKRYEEYDKEVRANGGLNPQNTSSGVMPMVDISKGTYTFGPFSMTYLDKGTSFDGGISYAGITEMYIEGYNSLGVKIKDIPIGSIVLADGATGSVSGAGSSLKFFNPKGNEKIDSNMQVYPKSGQSFYIIINNPNVGVTTEQNCITSISVKVKFQYMLANGQKSELSGKRYIATNVVTDTEHNTTHKVDEENGAYHYDKCSSCEIVVSKSETSLQGMIIADAIRTLYEEEIELYASIPTPPTPTPSTPDTTVKEYNYVDFSFNLAGNVWEDIESGKEGKLNGLMDKDEVKLKNIKVTLYFADTGEKAWFINTSGKNKDTLYSYINPTYTDENGHYEFRGLDPMRRYYITFEYDGQIYMPTDYLVSGSEKTYSNALEMVNDNSYNSNIWQLNSKATENNTEREKYNKDFSSIRSYPENYEIRNPISTTLGKYNKTYTRLELMGYTLEANGKYSYDENKQLIDGYLYNKDGLEDRSLGYKEGKITLAIKNEIVKTGQYPSEERIKQIYSEIANSNDREETLRKIQFIEDCKMTAYTKAQNIENYNAYDKYVLKNDYVENYSSEDHYTYTTKRLLPDGSYEDIVVFVNEKHHEGIYEHAMYINLGLVRRAKTDIAISKDVYKVGVTINGQAQSYEYDSRDKQYADANESDGNSYEVPYEVTVRLSNADLAYYTATYNRAVYESDAQSYKYLDMQNSLQVYVTYKIVLYNDSQGIRTRINEIVDYYDKDYTLVPEMSWAMYGDSKSDVRLPNSKEAYDEMLNARGISYGSEGYFKNYKEIKSFAESSQYGKNTQVSQNELNKEGYNALYIKLNDGNAYTLKPGQSEYIYLTFKVNGKYEQNEYKGLALDASRDKQNVAEINGYTTWYNDNTILPNGIVKNSSDYAGIIDVDSNPGNYIRENGGKYLEDDTDMARGIRIYADNDWVRTIDGIAWEDKRTYSPNGTNALIGNGVYDNGELGIAGIPVSLYEVKYQKDASGNIVKDANGNALKQYVLAKIYDGNNFKDAITTTGADGKYSFNGYVPGDYVVRFTYNGKTLDGQNIIYNGQDYKSTTYQMNLSTGKGINQNGKTVVSNPNSTGYIEYNGYTNVEGQNETATYGYDIKKADELGLRISDAKDIWSKREEFYTHNNGQYLNGVTNATATSEGYLKPEMIAETGVIRVEVEYNRESSNGSSNRNANNVDNSVNGNYNIRNVDFGLEERPKAGLELNEKVSNVKVTLADKTVLFDATKSAEDLIWQAKTPYNVNELKSKNIVDDIGPRATENKKYVYSDYAKYDDFRKYVAEHIEGITNLNNGLIQATMDEEIMHGATIQITYDMSITNIGEEDYNEKTFYYTGKVNNKANIVTTTANEVIDYVENNLQYREENNSAYSAKFTGKGWRAITQEEAFKYLSSSEPNNVQGAINNKYNTILMTTGLAQKLVPVNSESKIANGKSTVQTKLVLTQTITSQNTSDDLLYKNISEIVSISNDVGRRMAFSIQGNQNPMSEVITEPDASRAENVVILPPFGTHYLYIGLSIFVVAIIAVAVIVIKKTILKK